MVIQNPVTYTFKYSDGWEETWSPRAGALRESKISLAFRLLDEVGVEYTVAFTNPTELEGIPSENPPATPDESTQKTTNPLEEDADDLELAINQLQGSGDLEDYSNDGQGAEPVEVEAGHET